MNCYFCEQTPAPGGMRIKNITADGVCHDCGAAVCRDHGRRTAGQQPILLCQDCAQRAADATFRTGGQAQSA